MGEKQRIVKQIETMARKEDSIDFHYAGIVSTGMAAATNGSNCHSMAKNPLAVHSAFLDCTPYLRHVADLAVDIRVQPR